MSTDLLLSLTEKAGVLAARDEKWGPTYRRLLSLTDGLDTGWKNRSGKMTQNELIINHMKKNGSITMREAFLDYSIQSFSKRISELRDSGYDIRGLRRKHPVTNQEYTRYYLVA